MAHISSIGAVIFTDLAVAFTANTGGVATVSGASNLSTEAALNALFPVVQTGDATKFLRIKNVREFPAFGAQPNLIKVPTYGSKTTQTVGGQSDMPDFTVTINYIPSDWVKGTTPSVFANGEVTTRGSELGNMVGDNTSRWWRLALLGAQPTATGTATLAPYGSGATGIGTTPGGNSMFYFFGRIESIQITPSLTDASTATLAFSLQSEFFGAFTA